ncbi:MAG: helix-turn-helix domain-containing protein [Alphaproteobacteria bacterium]
MIAENKNKLFTTKETSQYIGITQGTLAVWRTTKRYKIPYIKIGRLVKYRKSDLDTWIESRTQQISNSTY